ncbi:MAG: LCP family protein [Selenomonadaceae bacterium]|nr:LCP family protein [Selenomonadaceae bacterium]
MIFLVLCFAASALAGALVASSSLFDDKDPVRRIVVQNTEEELIKAKDKSTVLIMGVDIRKDDVGRSDTMMIATIDPRLDQATLLSIPRDTRVKIRGRGYDKINAAFAYGGVSLAESTVENFLGIDIDHYVLIDTSSFVKIIDAIGGVDIDVEKRMYYEDPWDDNGGLVIDLYPGQQHMDGKTAVTYVRYRDSEGDIGRVKRQQAFMAACMDKVTSPEIIPRIPNIAREVMDAVETDMSLRQLLELAGALKAAASNGLEADMVPGYPLYIDEISYWIPDVELLRISVADALGIRVDPYLRERFERDAREYRDSIPSGARDIPDGEDNIGSPVRERQRYNDRRGLDERSRLRESRIDDERTNPTERRTYDDERTNPTERRTYDDERTNPTERRTYDDERTNPTERRTYDDERTNPTERRTYDDDRTNPTERRTYDEPQIERRKVPEVNERIDEPIRDEAPKTR